MPAYKIVIPSAGRAATIRTPRLFPFERHDIVCHDENDAAWYRRNPTLGHAVVHASGCPPGIARQRNWILDNLVAPGQWVLMMDDNIRQIEKVDPHFYFDEEVDRTALNSSFWRKIFRQTIAWPQVEAVLFECIQKAENIGANLIGFASAENPYFNHKKWNTIGVVVTKMALVRKTHLRFDESFTAKDDVEFSGANLAAFGRVLINHFMRPVAPHFQAGGIGNRAMRLEASRSDAAALVRKYPTLFRINTLRKPVGSEVILRVHSDQIKSFANAQK